MLSNTSETPLLPECLSITNFSWFWLIHYQMHFCFIDCNIPITIWLTVSMWSNASNKCDKLHRCYHKLVLEHFYYSKSFSNLLFPPLPLATSAMLSLSRFSFSMHSVYITDSCSKWDLMADAYQVSDYFDVFP